MFIEVVLQCFLSLSNFVVKIKLSMQQAVGARVMRRGGYHIFLDSRLTDGAEVVNPTHRLGFKPRKIPGSYFC
jgi:phage-related protein